MCRAPGGLAAAAGGLLGRLSGPEGRLPPRQWRQDGARPPRALEDEHSEPKLGMGWNMLEQSNLTFQALKRGKYPPRYPRYPISNGLDGKLIIKP